MLLIEKEWAFHLHLHNSFTDDSMVMQVDIHDFARMFDSLSEYFQRESFVIANAQPFSTPINLNNNSGDSLHQQIAAS